MPPHPWKHSRPLLRRLCQARRRTRPGAPLTARAWPGLEPLEPRVLLSVDPVGRDAGGAAVHCDGPTANEADGAALASNTVTIAENSVARAVIVTVAGADPSVQYAASELAGFLGRVTGATFQIVGQASTTRANLFVGPDAARLADPAFTTQDLGEDGIVVRSIGDDLIIAGGAPRGTLYAVYDFLERYAGVRWWTATESTIPDRPTLVVGDVDVRHVPAITYRETDYAGALDGDFAARSRLNGQYQLVEARHGGRALSFVATGKHYVHTFWTYLPPETYFAAHPEWYAVVDGQPNARGLNLTSVPMRQTFTANVRSFLTASPHATILDISYIDDGVTSQDPASAAIIAAEGSPMGLLLRFVNAIAEELEPEFPQVTFSTLAYQDTVTPPRITTPRRNVLVRLSDIASSFSVPLDHPRNQAFADDLAAWSVLTDRLHVWDYVANFTFPDLPHPNLRVLGPNLRFLTDHGVTGVFEEAAPGRELAELRAWVLAKLMWDPGLDGATLIETFVEGYYGPAAGHVLAYLDLMHDAVATSGDYLGLSSPPTADFLAPSTLEAAWAHMEAAASAVQGDAALSARVQRVQASVLNAMELRGIVGDLAVTASSAHGLRPPGMTINGSGLTADGLRHLSLGDDPALGFNAWLSGTTEASRPNAHAGTVPGSHWIAFEFDQVSRIETMSIWNYHEWIPEHNIDWRRFGARNVTIQYSATGGDDPAAWATVYDGAIPMTPASAEAPVSLVVDFGGALASHVVITTDSGAGQNWSNGQLDGAGLSEVRFDRTIAAPAAALGDPSSANGWDTRSAVTIAGFSSQHASRSWTHVIDGSGISGEQGLYHTNQILPAGSTTETMGISRTLAASMANPRGGTVAGGHWVEFAFDRVYALTQMWIWNYNEIPWSEQGFNGVTIEYATTGGRDPAEWHTIHAGPIPRAGEGDAAPPDLIVDFRGAAARHVVITTGAVGYNHSVNLVDAGLSEVRFFGHEELVGIDGADGHFVPRSGLWQAVQPPGTYRGSAVDGGDAITVFEGTAPLAADFDYVATITTRDGGIGSWTNGLLIFDWHGPRDFKYAGGFFGADVWRIGRFDGTDWLVDATAGQALDVGVAHHVTLVVRGEVATLRVDGIDTVSHDFGDPLNDGRVGLATRRAVTDFDDLQLERADVTAPRVVGVVLNGTGWSAAYRTAIGLATGSDPDRGYGVPLGSADQLLPFPGGSIDQIGLVFSEPVEGVASSFTVRGVRVPTYGVSAYAWDGASRTATWTLDRPVPTDRLRIELSDAVRDAAGHRLDGEWVDGLSAVSGDGAAGGAFAFALSVAPGDMNRDGVASVADLWYLRRALADYRWEADINGDGAVDRADAAWLRRWLGRRLP